jgi:alkylhydroperoxidase family enzyme
MTATFTRHDTATAPQASRPLLEETRLKFGAVPNLHAYMAEAPGLLEAYLHLHRLFLETSFTPVEQTVVWQTINVEHACHYCVPAHTGIANRMKVPDEVTQALRDETPLPDARLEALRTFTLAMVRRRGAVSPAEIDTFVEAGFTQRQVLEVVLGTAHKVMSNYSSKFLDTPVEPYFQPYVWNRRASGTGD